VSEALSRLREGEQLLERDRRWDTSPKGGSYPLSFLNFRGKPQLLPLLQVFSPTTAPRCHALRVVMTKLMTSRCLHRPSLALIGTAMATESGPAAAPGRVLSRATSGADQASLRAADIEALGLLWFSCDEAATVARNDQIANLEARAASEESLANGSTAPATPGDAPTVDRPMAPKESSLP
jgi:hypothetical protein